jgi:hypothetical protein
VHWWWVIFLSCPDLPELISGRQKSGTGRLR